VCGGVHTPERGTHASRDKPCCRGTVFDVLREQRGVCAHPSVEHTLAGASPAIVALSLMRYENREMCAVECTHLSVEHTLTGASPAIVALSLTCCENRGVCAGVHTPERGTHALGGVHTPERGTHARRGKSCHRGAVFGALRE